MTVMHLEGHADLDLDDALYGWYPFGYPDHSGSPSISHRQILERK